MSASYNSHSFAERGEAGRNIPRWNKKRQIAVKIIPAGSPVIQDIGADVQTLTMPVQGTESEINALFADCDGSTHTLSWSGGTDTCLLTDIAPMIEVAPGASVFQTVLTFIK